jgi:glycosyltransferase involved in cell wall biosynthesis
MITQLVPHTAPVDGIHRAALEYTAGLADRGGRSLVLTLAHGAGRGDWEQIAEVKEAMPFLDCAPSKPASIGRVVAVARALPTSAEVVIAHRIDLVNAAALVALRQRARLVLHAHNAPPPWVEWGDLLRIPGSRLTVKVIVASQYMRDTWVRTVPGSVPVEVVEYAIACDYFDLPAESGRVAARSGFGLGPDRLVLAFIGRLEECKGLHVLAAAAADLASERPVHLLIQGAPGRDVSEAEAEAYRARCESALAGTGRTWVKAGPDVRRVMAASDVVVVPSVWAEPSGLVVSEALATGTPVVASRSGGIPEQLPDSPLVALAEPGSPAALAQAIRGVASATPTEALRAALRARVVEPRSRSVATERYLRALQT